MNFPRLNNAKGIKIPPDENSKNGMKFQLVLQWQASAIKDYDVMISIEDALIEKLKTGEVDGHDAGSSEVNIFVHTNDACATFEEIKNILGTKDFWVNAQVAFREIGGNSYTVLWPAHQESFRVS